MLAASITRVIITLMMEAASTSELLSDYMVLQPRRQPHYTYCCGNLKSNMKKVLYLVSSKSYSKVIMMLMIKHMILIFWLAIIGLIVHVLKSL
jgi:hypothetical protein